jgi:hypothetical protein
VITRRDFCVDCNRQAPLTLTPHTLIANGWRVTKREDNETGAVVFEWHCDQCWTKARQGRLDKAEAERQRKSRTT